MFGLIIGAEIFQYFRSRHRVLAGEDDQGITAFTTHNGLFEFPVMPFCLCNVPVTSKAYGKSAERVDK